MEQVLMEEIIETDYGQFDLVWGPDGGFDGDWDRFFTGQVNGLVGAADPDGVYLSLGRRSGGSSVRAVLTTGRPRDDDEWEDVVEVSIEVPPGSTTKWYSWASESAGTVSGLAAGRYRLRVSARGRDEGNEHEPAEDVVDFYLLHFWPAPLEPDAIIRVGSSDAAYWHRQVGNRR